jgi:hypothetical protein
MHENSIHSCSTTQKSKKLVHHFSIPTAFKQGSQNPTVQKPQKSVCATLVNLSLEENFENASNIQRPTRKSSPTGESFQNIRLRVAA